MPDWTRSSHGEAGLQLDLAVETPVIERPDVGERWRSPRLDAALWGMGADQLPLVEPVGGLGHGATGDGCATSRSRRCDSIVAVLHVIGFDHLVLRCADVEASLAWYINALGLTEVRVAEWRNGEAPFPSVRVNAETIIDLIPRKGDIAERNLDHLCLVVDDLAAITADRFRIVDGPATRYGAQGNGTSVYVLDPDGNVVELRSYTNG
jgi:catechol 2,3-dioxygenase-like lactoylglutathione lyase family enzyme